MPEPKQPMQPIVWRGNVIRFKENAIIRYLCDANIIDLNKISMLPVPNEDRMQFWQMLGYSVSGFGDLSFADPEIVREADKIADKMYKAKHRKWQKGE